MKKTDSDIFPSFLKILILIASLILVSSIPIFLTRAQTIEIIEDFENWNENKWSNSTQFGGIIIIPSSAANHSGNYGALMYDSSPETSSTANVYRTNFTESWTYFVDFYWRCTNKSVATQTSLLTICDLNFIDKCELHINEGVNFTLQQTIDSNFSISLNTWYRICVGFYKHNSSGFRRLWINGNLLIEQLDIDTDTTGKKITEIWISTGTFAGGQTRSHFDDITITNVMPDYLEVDLFPIWMLGLGFLICGLCMVFVPIGIIAKERPKPSIVVKLAIIIIIGLGLLMAIPYMEA